MVVPILNSKDMTYSTCVPNLVLLSQSEQFFDLAAALFQKRDVEIKRPGMVTKYINK